MPTRFDRITRKLLLLLCCTVTFTYISANTSLLSEYTVTVLDGDTGEPLIGAAIINITQNPSRDEGLTTDIDGKAILKNVGHRDLIELSYLGYLTKRVPFYSIRETKGIVKLVEGTTTLGTVVVVGRKDQPEEEIPYVVERIDRKTIAFSNAQTSADILSSNGNVYVQKSQLGGGSPILRGFEANRVLLVVDGVRMNNAIYRSGHLQNSISIDNSILERAEVIYGPGSLMYGSDALGGVVHYRTRDPKVLMQENTTDDYIFKTNMYTRFSTANREKAIHADLEYSTTGWGSLTSITFADYGDLITGSERPEGYPDFGTRKFFVLNNEGVDEIRSRDENEQTGTTYSQIDLLQKVKYQPSDHLYFILNLQYSNSSNVPRYDALLDTIDTADDLKWADWYYGPQQRMFASLKTRILGTSMFDKGSLIASAQRIDEDRLKRKFRKTHRTFNLEDINVYTLTGDFDKYIGKSQRSTFSYGFEGNYNQVASSAGRMDINTGNVIYDELTRYPSGGSTMRTLAGYLTYNWKSRDSTFNFNAGTRYTDIETQINYLASDADLIDWPEVYYDGLGIKNNAMTWAAGFTWQSKDLWQLRAITSTAFRAPNLDDLAKIRPKNSKVTVPNLDLKPEYSLNYEATLGKQFSRLNSNGGGAYFKLAGTAFYTELTNVIVREPGLLPNGEPVMYVDGKLHDVQQNTNAGEGFVYGLSGNAELNISDKFIIQSSINITKGRRIYKEEVNGILIDTLVPLAHIPPMYGRTSLIFKTSRFRVEGVVRYNGAKKEEEYAVGAITYDPENGYVIDREGMSDNIEMGLINKNPAPGESIYDGLTSWMTYNLYTSFRFSDQFSINLAVENITDIHYRNFGSGISAPGRNFVIALHGNF